MHTRSSHRVASRKSSIFSLSSRHVPVVSRRMGLQSAKARAEWKIAKCPDEIGPWSVHFSTYLGVAVVVVVVVGDIDPIHGGFAWSFVRRDGTRCPGRRAVIEGSFHGVRLETLNLSRLLSPSPPLPERGRVSLRLPSFFSIFTSPLSSGRQLFFTYVYIVHTREDIRILGTYLS